MHIHSQHPYLLGFDNNLVPNPNILVFQPYPGEDSEYSEQSGRFAWSSASSLGNIPNIRENRLDWGYFTKGYSRVYYKGRMYRSSIRPILIRKTRIIGKIYIFISRVQSRYRIHRLFARFGEKTRIIGKFYTFIFICSLQVPNTSTVRQIRGE